MVNNYISVVKKTLVRCYYAFFGEEVAQVKKINPTAHIISTLTTAIMTATTATVRGGATHTDGTILVASAAQVVSIAYAHRDIQTQNLRFRG